MQLPLQSGHQHKERQIVIISGKLSVTEQAVEKIARELGEMFPSRDAQELSSEVEKHKAAYLEVIDRIGGLAKNGANTVYQVNVQTDLKLKEVFGRLEVAEGKTSDLASNEQLAQL